jgi:GTP cyclohydrolase II
MFSYINREFSKAISGSQKQRIIDFTGAEIKNPMTLDKPMPLISLIGPVPLPISLERGEALFSWYVFTRYLDLKNVQLIAEEVQKGSSQSMYKLLNSTLAVNSALVFGNFEEANAPLVRVHSCCITGDVFGSLRCDCQSQLKVSFQKITAEGAGAVIYYGSHEGRGIGLYAKAATYILQDMGYDTYEANEKLGLPKDSRDFHEVGGVIKFLRPEGPIRLLTNNPLKIQHLKEAGINIDSAEKIVAGLSPYNKRYMRAKKNAGHAIDDQDIQGS